ncbi:methylated-DNA--protein-cysteine methyltransferase [Pteropus vampyrus]|uniref:Methylated-DNA--protein-cysteine methyltransferase n=1 Tax=Pteropus vampyrus TaxID=132908 RepID=A0A6P3RJD1_PTEVA|nr:methylated-DNA--protein-cysteine methyltransferase [Pteropus vampyrus]
MGSSRASVHLQLAFRLPPQLCPAPACAPRLRGAHLATASRPQVFARQRRDAPAREAAARLPAPARQYLLGASLTELLSCPHLCSPPEAPAPRKLLGDPGTVMEPLAQCAAWLVAYFHEPRTLSALPVPALHHPIFQQDSFTGQVLWKLLKAVKFGEVVSYQQLAALAGSPKASRAVGGAMRSNPVPILVPCHRVVCSSGAVGNYSGGPAVKEWLLTHEGSLAGGLARVGRS